MCLGCSEKRNFSDIVIDTNILIAALIKESAIRKIITNSNNLFIIPEFELEEVKNNKQEIIEKTGYSEREFDVILLRLLNYVKIAYNHIICKYSQEAYQIIGKIDKDDVQIIAAALAFNCPIWSDDKHFKKQNKIKILTTKDVYLMWKE